jgi:subtilisin family serine protease
MKKRAVRPPGGTPPTQKDDALPTGPTGRYLIVLNPDTQKSIIRSLNDTAGLKVASSRDFEDGANGDDLGGADALLLEHLNVAVVDADGDQLRSLESAVADENNPVLTVEPEEFVVPLVGEVEETPAEAAEAMLTEAGRQYLLGYQDAVRALSARLIGAGGHVDNDDAAGVSATFVDTATLTWGLQATRAHRTLHTGAGIRIAVLDTGMDLRHPDFTGRPMVTASFVPGQSVQDGHGHGTHCIGTACGPRTPPGGARRYGVAGQSIILAGKVLSNAGSGQDGWILAGINWAIQNRAAVISMSLGSQVAVGASFKQSYEQAAQSALNNNCLIIAAAGNSFNTPVASPANCPSIMAVAALTNTLQRAAFSCLGINPNGGEINIAAPGVNVYSSVPMPARYGFKSGTSMATPHVAGLAALWAQSSGLRGTALWRRLVSRAVNLALPKQMVGAGLSVAPTLQLFEETTAVEAPAIDLPVPLRRGQTAVLAAKG